MHFIPEVDSSIQAVNEVNHDSVTSSMNELKSNVSNNYTSKPSDMEPYRDNKIFIDLSEQPEETTKATTTPGLDPTRSLSTKEKEPNVIMISIENGTGTVTRPVTRPRRKHRAGVRVGQRRNQIDQRAAANINQPKAAASTRSRYTRAEAVTHKAVDPSSSSRRYKLEEAASAAYKPVFSKYPCLRRCKSGIRKHRPVRSTSTGSTVASADTRRLD